MRFLLKSAFWLGGVFLIMPGLTGKDQPAPARPDAPAVNSNPLSADLISQWQKAGKTLQDISQFCENNKILCASGALAVSQMQQHSADNPSIQDMIRKTANTTIAAPNNTAPAKTTAPKALIPIPAKRPN